MAGPFTGPRQLWLQMCDGRARAVLAERPRSRSFCFRVSHNKNAFTPPPGQALPPPGKPDAWGRAQDRKVGFKPRILAVGSEP